MNSMQVCRKLFSSKMLNINKNRYFFNSFFWNILTKVLNAVLGFISVPLLLGYFGKADYGLLGIATACNGYMSIMDLGMNVGAVKFFSQWEAEDKRTLVHRVARTNISFYLLISIVNIIGLLFLAFYGEHFFSVSHSQFLQLRSCFFILAIFSTISWCTTAFNQLLIAYKKIVFTLQIQSFLVILRGILLCILFLFDLSLSQYFFYLTLIVSAAAIPYVWECLNDNLIDSLKPAAHWKEFKVVLYFSLSIFALSIFQVSAIQSRPIILSIFSVKGADSVADYRILKVIPQFIITVCGTFTSIFLPKSSEMLIKNSTEEIQEFINSWTKKTTIIVCILCFPFIIGARDILEAYVGKDFVYLSVWLQIWCFFLIIQMHSTPAFSFIMACGKTKLLIISTGIACVLSIVINISLCKVIPVGSAVIGYIVYMVSLIGVYYLYIYPKYLNLFSSQIFYSFIKPLAIGIVCCTVPYLLDIGKYLCVLSNNSRINSLLIFSIQALLWLTPYLIIIYTIRKSDLKKQYDIYR